MEFSEDCTAMAEQGCDSTIIKPCSMKRRCKFRDKGLSRCCFLLTLVVALTGVSASCQDATHTRRQLAVNLTKSVIEDGEALLLIKAAILSDPLNVTYWWKRSGANRVLAPCKTRNLTAQYWPGINCTNRRVTAINLANMSLAGTLSPYLGALTFLRTVDLSNNLFTGPIPSELLAASNLEVLNLADNRLGGTLPAINATNLTSLNVANNGITGKITIGDLRQLETLNMTGNNLTGAIPEAINGCERLAVLDLSRNALQGDVPLRNLTSLAVLRLERNQLEGEFVSRLETLGRLEDIDLSHNLLNGSITRGISTLQLRRQLKLHENNLTGTIPESLWRLALVARIDLSCNSFRGGIPASVGELLALQELNVSVNQLRGVIPPSLAQLPLLVMLDVSRNEFAGGLPSFARTKSLRWLDATDNSLTGNLPERFVDYEALQYLNVSYNRKLSGLVPPFREHDGVTRESFRKTGLCGPSIGISCHDKSRTSTVVSIAVGSAVAFVVIFVILYVLCSRHRKKEQQHKKFAHVSTEFETKLTPEAVARATRGFQDKIGDSVFRGVLGETRVAVRKLDGVHGAAVAAGLEGLAQQRHWSLVEILGFCCAPELTAIVTELMPTGSLYDLMYNNKADAHLNWTQRFNAAIGVAQGLRYLHHECAAPTVHGNLKPSNIMFNTFMEARITAFGVAKLVADHGGASQRDHSYTAPESTYTMKGDVFSFGVILLEMISGRSPRLLPAGVSMPQWIRATLTDSKSLPNILDPVLFPELDANQQKISMVLGVALLCTREHPQERPYITEVLKMLNHIKARPTRGSQRFKTSPSTHLRNEEIRHEVPGIEIAPSPPVTPGARTPGPQFASPSSLSQNPSLSAPRHSLTANLSLSSWTPSPENR